MTTPDYRALCSELVDALSGKLTCSATRKAVARARSFLASPEAVGVADEALAHFTEYFCRNYPGPDTIIHKPEWHAPKIFKAAAYSIARYGAHPAPIPVGERLPGKEDCTEDGEVWVIESGYSYALGDTGDYDWEPHRIVLRSIGEFDARNGRTWLPHWALPLPGVE